MGCPVPIETSILQPLPLRLRELNGRGGRNIVGATGPEYLYEIVSFIYEIKSQQ